MEENLYECLVNELPTEDAIYETETPNLHLLPSTIDLVGAELELVTKKQREYVMKKVLDQVKDKYDYIIIDCLPSLGIITLNALSALRFCFDTSTVRIFFIGGIG